MAKIQISNKSEVEQFMLAYKWISCFNGEPQGVSIFERQGQGETKIWKDDSVNVFTWQVVHGGQVELTFSEFNKKTMVRY